MNEERLEFKVDEEQAWMLYDLVTQRVGELDKLENEIRGPAGGERWRNLQRSLRMQLGLRMVEVGRRSS